MIAAGFWGFALLAFSAAGAAAPAGDAAGPLERALRAFALESPANAQAYTARSESLWVELARGPVRAWVGGKTDTMPALPTDDFLMRELRAYYLHEMMLEYASMTRERPSNPTLQPQDEWDRALRTQYLGVRRRYKKSETRARFDPDTSSLLGPGWPRYKADLALTRRDTAAALAAYRAGWKHFEIDEDYISLVNLYRAQGTLEDALLEEGLKVHAEAPAVHALVFSLYLEGRDPARVAKAVELASRAQSKLWPLSVDWKIRYAQALSAAGRPREAEGVLMKALAVLDEDPLLKPGAPEAVRLRREIFALLETPGR